MRKIPTLFKRDPEDMSRVLPEVHPDCQWVLDGEGVATRKYDGTCVQYQEEGVWWARREVKPGKMPPPHYIAVEVDEVTGKTVGWEPVEQSPFAKYHAEALANEAILDQWPIDSPQPMATYELVGPKVNGNPEQAPEHLLVRHGYQAKLDRDELNEIDARTFDCLRAWLLDHPGWEGIGLDQPDGAVARGSRGDGSCDQRGRRLMDDRQAAFDAVREIIQAEPATASDNARVWRCVHAALDVLSAAKDAEIERLADEASNAVANAIADQATFKSLSVEEGAAVLELGWPRQLVIAWVDAARKMLGDAENYSETRIDFPAVAMEVKAAGEVDRYVFTVQRAGKLTPHEARMRAESSRRAWAEEAMRLELDLERHRELLHNIWLYVDWRKVTRQLTTEQKDMWADAVEATSEIYEPGAPAEVDRWWRDPSFSRPVCAVHEEGP